MKTQRPSVTFGRPLCILAAAMLWGTAALAQPSAVGERLLREAHALYQAQRYAEAAAKYEEVVAAHPALADAYFFLANSYDNQYRVTRRGDPENDALLDKAIEHYRTRAGMNGGDPKIKRLASEYLVSAYGPEKKDDPAGQEPILLGMIAENPQDITAYFGLANIYEQSGDFHGAEDALTRARLQDPKDPAVYMQLAGFHNRQGAFDKAIEALHARAEIEPDNPEAFYTIASYYWEKAYRDAKLPRSDQLRFTLAGLSAVDEAIALKPDYFEALTYKNLLLRVQARIAADPVEQQRLLTEAKQYEGTASEVRKRQMAQTPSGGQ